MLLQFATCERPRALRFLQKLYPSCTVADTPESAGPVLDYVEADIIRIGDPDHHRGAVFASKGTPDQIAAATDAMRAFHAATMLSASPQPRSDKEGG